MNLTIDYQSLNKNLLFACLIILSFFLVMIMQEILITDELYFEFYDSKLPGESIHKIIDFKNDWSWLNYPLTPLIYLLKFTMISLWFITVSVFAGYKTSFKKLFQATILAEFVMFIPIVVRIVWFGLVNTDYTLEELQVFNPLSLISLFNADELEAWLVYPVQAVNLYEIIYILILTKGMKYAINKDFETSLRFTLPAYLSGMLIWIIFITFLTINFTS